MDGALIVGELMHPRGRELRDHRAERGAERERSSGAETALHRGDVEVAVAQLQSGVAALLVAIHLPVCDVETDPGTGVMRHADAGYETAIEVARERGIDLPMLDAD